MFIVGVCLRAGIAVLVRDTARRGSSLGGSPERRTERRTPNTPRIKAIAFSFIGMSVSRWRLLDPSVALTDRRLYCGPLGCLGASTATDRASSIAARGSRRRLGRRGRGR